MPSSILCRVEASVTELRVASPNCNGCSVGPVQVGRDVPLGIVSGSLPSPLQRLQKS
jgi:hypothetical protein